MLEPPVKVQVATITEIDDEDEEAVESAYLHITVTAKQTCTFNALIDEGADFNVLTHDHWTQLGKPPLQPTNAKLSPYGGRSYALLGKCRAAVSIKSETVPMIFYVLPNTKDAGTDSLLGKTFKK